MRFWGAKTLARLYFHSSVIGKSCKAATTSMSNISTRCFYRANCFMPFLASNCAIGKSRTALIPLGSDPRVKQMAQGTKKWSDRVTRESPALLHQPGRQASPGPAQKDSGAGQDRTEEAVQ
jgi:hypothetical protein